MNGMTFRIGAIAGVPVHLSIWYFILMVFFVQDMGGPAEMVLFGIAMTVSLLTHEMGHAMVAKWQGLDPSVTLHGMGGHCTHLPASSDKRDAVLVAAGPGAGLVLGLSAGVILFVAGRAGASLPYLAETFLTYMLWIGVVWSIFNLLPIYPMDGGKLTRLALLRLFGADRGHKIAHISSLVFCAGGLALAIVSKQIFLGFIVAYFAYQNWQLLQAGSGVFGARPAPKGPDPQATAMLMEAEDALEDGDYKEAQRLAYVARSMPNNSDAMEAHAWEIVCIAAQRFGQPSECERLASRASQTPRLLESLILAALARGARDTALKLTENSNFNKLPAQRRQDLMARIG
jgi:Zn-dependent protease